MITTGKVTGIVSNLVTVQVDGPVAENELCSIDLHGTGLLAEVIKVTGDRASVQVFESTRGLAGGAKVEFLGRMLEVTLGPGMLGSVYDGLQNDLTTMSDVFLKRGEYTDPLNREKKWGFKPIAAAGDKVQAADWLGEVTEGWLPHKIMVPFSFKGEYTVKSVAPAGDYTVDETIAVLEDAEGAEVPVTMTQRWPVKVAVKAYREKPRPQKIMETGVRVIDSFNPIAEGGTGFIPGPFGCGKTVLQHAIAKQGEADVIVMAACGERANEVVEIFTEFPELVDPYTGRKLMERTTIICNTSNMPVAAREASVYTAMTICEYYRAMGLRCLLLADSTSRWAQALREVSGRLEEIPGEEAFPAYLESLIANFYERAGYVKLYNGQNGSVTIGGTVSPAGGNFEEPVTQGTLKVVGAFHGLSRERSDARRYPAINPLDSWSKYPNPVSEKVPEARALLRRGNEVNQMMKVVGEEGTSMEDFVIFLKSEFLDNAFLQQDSFDEVDAACSLERQRYVFDKMLSILKTVFTFDTKDTARRFFLELTREFKNWNISPWGSEKCKEAEDVLDKHVAERRA